jgi:hypothetical protein
MNVFSHTLGRFQMPAKPHGRHGLRRWQPSMEILEDRCTPSSGMTSIAFNFNPTPIAAGSTVWFSSGVQAGGLGNGPVTLQFTNQSIAFTAGGSNYNVSVPNSTITFTPGTTVATTTYSASTNTWITAVPSNLGGSDFLGGVALAVPSGLPGGISNVNWQGQMQSDTLNVQAQWHWGAAVYASFATDYTTLNVKPCDDSHASSYQNGDHAGTPEAFKTCLIAGATGDGNPQNATGQPSPNAQLIPPQPVSLAGYTALSTNFNPTPIAAGSTLWFSSAFQAHGVGNGPVTLQFINQTIAFTANGTSYSVNVPNATVTFSSSTTAATTTFNASTNTWTTAVPSNLAGNVFFSGAALAVPAGLPGNIMGVTWKGQMQSDTSNVQVQWQWGTAVYTSFATDYTTLNVKPVDDGHASSYQNNDKAGTPEAFKAYLTSGATGGGASNYTGQPSQNTQLTPPVPPPPGVTYISGNSSDYPFTSSNPLTSVAFNESDVLTGAAMNANNGTFEVWYTDEHALTLGVNQVTVIAANGTSTTTNYPVTALNGDPGAASNPAVGTTVATGDQAGTDPAGRPLAPSLYITDITNNPNSRSGDWQYGGTPVSPSSVFGTWKTYTKTVDYTRGGTVTLSGANDPAQNGWNLGAGADTPPPGLSTEGYTAEVRWNLSDLVRQGLILPGHNYRFYVMVHDGDQNKSGGDVGQASYQLNNPVPVSSQPASLSGFVYQDNGIGSLSGFGGVTLTLTGTTSSGQQVNVSVTTNSDGSYSFGNLQAGTYIITETVPSGYTFEGASVGTVNGAADGSAGATNIYGITLNAGNAGINYNFTDVLGGGGSS